LVQSILMSTKVEDSGVLHFLDELPS